MKLVDRRRQRSAARSTSTADRRRSRCTRASSRPSPPSRANAPRRPCAAASASRAVSLPRLHDAIHADVANAALRVARDHHRQRDVRAAVLRPARHEWAVDAGRYRSPRQTTLLAGRRAGLHSRRKLPDLEQPRQQRELREESLGDLEVHEACGDAVADIVEVLDAERHAIRRIEPNRLIAERERGARAVREDRRARTAAPCRRPAPSSPGRRSRISRGSPRRGPSREPAHRRDRERRRTPSAFQRASLQGREKA